MMRVSSHLSSVKHSCFNINVCTAFCIGMRSQHFSPFSPCSFFIFYFWGILPNNLWLWIVSFLTFPRAWIKNMSLLAAVFWADWRVLPSTRGYLAVRSCQRAHSSLRTAACLTGLRVNSFFPAHYQVFDLTGTGKQYKHRQTHPQTQRQKVQRQLRTYCIDRQTYMHTQTYTQVQAQKHTDSLTLYPGTVP